MALCFSLVWTTEWLMPLKGMGWAINLWKEDALIRKKSASLNNYYSQEEGIMGTASLLWIAEPTLESTPLMGEAHGRLGLCHSF